MDLLAQTVTVPAPVIVYKTPMWQVAAVGGVVLLLGMLLVVLIVACVASFRRGEHGSR